MTVENDVYKLILTQPKVDDMGKYTIDIGGITSSAYLTVEGESLLKYVFSYQPWIFEQKKSKINFDRFPS